MSEEQNILINKGMSEDRLGVAGSILKCSVLFKQKKDDVWSNVALI